MLRHARSLSLLLPFLLITTITCLAQTGTSRVTGTVTDSTGAVVPGATITLMNEATGLSQTQTTTDAGIFAFGSLPVGDYTILVEHTGFKKYQKKGNKLEAETPLALDVVLEVGQLTETVTVQGGAEQLQTSNATIGNVVERKAIERLPLNGRNPLTLILMEPGVVQRSSSAASNTISVNGSRDRAFNITVDGIDANEASVPTGINNVYRLNPDMVQEYKVTTNNASAEEGRNSGASVSIATRSGGNDFHGTAYYFHRNDALNTNEFFANAQGQDKPLIKLHQYGFELNGPIRKQKTFFFGSYQGNQIAVTQPIDQTFGVPTVYTPTALSGVFRYFVVDPKVPFKIGNTVITQNRPELVDPATGALRPEVPLCSATVQTNCVATYNLFANDPAKKGLDPVAGALFKSYPTPNSYAFGDGLNTGGFLWNPPTQFKGPAITVRVDHNFNQNNSVFVRWLQSRYNTLKGDPLNGRPQVFPGDFPALGEVFRDSKNLAINYRRVFSPRFVNSLTVGFARFQFLFTQGEADPRFPNVPPFDFTTVSEPFNNTPRTFRALTTPQMLDTATYVSGNHVLGFGANVRLYRHVDQRGQPGGINVTPSVTFSSANRSPVACSTTVTTNCFANLPAAFAAVSSSSPSGRAGISSNDNAFLLSSINNLLGIPARISQTYLADLNADAFLPFKTGDNVTLWGEKHVLNQYNFYAQDEWKFRPNLTLNYGLRLEINPAPSSPGFTYVPSTPIVGSSGPATPAVNQPGSVTFVKADSWFNRNNWTLGPRLGLAWSPSWKTGLMRSLFGEPGRSVIRLGYGIAFDPVNTFMITAVAGRVPGLVTTCTSTLTNTAPFNTTTNGCTPAPNLRLSEGFPTELPPPSLKPSTFLTPTLQLYGNAPTLTMFDPNMKLPTVHQWSLSVQRELPAGFVAQVAYIGRRGTRLMRSYDINQISADPILDSFRALQTNLSRNCDPSGSNCPSGVTPVTVPFIANGTVAASVVNATAARTEISQGAAGAFAERIENNTLALKLRPNQQFNRITYIDAGGNSFYHALQVTVRRRFASGLGMNLAYTFGKSIDDGSIDPVGSSSGGGLSTTTSRAPVDARNFRLERARSDFDRTHVLSVGSVWELPVGRGKRFLNTNSGLLNQIVGGWSMNGIFTFMTGEPFSITSGLRTNNNAHISRALIVDPTVRVKLQELQNQTFAGPVLFANKDAFAVPEAGSNGGPRNVFTAPSYSNMDLGIVKMFQVTERLKLQFRTEVFNLFNHSNFENLRDASAGSGTNSPNSLQSTVFGRTCCATVAPPSTQTIIQTGESARVIQFALKVQW